MNHPSCRRVRPQGRWVALTLLVLAWPALAQETIPAAMAPLDSAGWSLRSSDPLEAQVRQVVQQQGYRLVWKLDGDFPAGMSAGTYTSWQQLVVDATQDIARMTSGPTVAAPLICPGSHQIIVALQGEARRLASHATGNDCVPLRADPVAAN